MTPIALSSIVFVCVFAGALLGMLLHLRLPEQHLSTESRDVIKLVMGLIATMSALVLSLLIATAKSSYDTQSTELTQLAANFIQLDRILAHYGSESGDARSLLQQFLAHAINVTWSNAGERTKSLDSVDTRARSDAFAVKIQELSPQNDFQRALRAQAIQIGADMGRLRSLLLEQNSSAIPMPFLVVLVFWLTILFLSFGLLAPSNATVVTALCVGALSVSGAIFLILALARPFEGMLQISMAPLQNALTHLSQ
jgi:hypothetical protein